MSKAKKEKVIRDYPGEMWIKVYLNGPTKRNDYYVSTYGRAKSFNRDTEREIEIKGSLDNKGYRRINVRLIEGHHSVFIHRVVAEHFVKKASKKHEFILHKDFNKTNNYYKNLVWATEEEWKAYLNEKKVKHQEENGGSSEKILTNNKLTESKVALIKKWLKTNKTKPKIIAKRFNVSLTQIRRIEREENWKEVQAAN